MRCAICGEDVRSGQASVLTNDGAVVHIACADHEANVAWTRRQWWALVHALVVVTAVAALLWVGIELWFLVLIGLGIITHPLIHRRFWHYLAHDIRRRLRR